MKNMYLVGLIKAHRSKFSELDEVLANYLLSLEDKVIVNKTLAEMSEESGVSQTTIYNFVKKLGFSGFQNFKIQLATKSENDSSLKKIMNYSDISGDDTPIEIAHKIIHFNQNSLEGLMKMLDAQTLENIVNAVSESKALYFFGQGGSSVVAFDAYHKFIRSNFHCNYISDYHIQMSYSTKLDHGDCCFLFSHTGETRETINLAKILKKNGCTVICLTGSLTSPLVSLADHSIVIVSEESKFRTESLTSRILYLTVMDVIYTAIMYREEEQNLRSLEKIREAIHLSRLNGK